MQVLTRVGHAVQEDDPDKVADIMANFLVRNKFTNPTGEFIRCVQKYVLKYFRNIRFILRQLIHRNNNNTTFIRLVRFCIKKKL